MKNKLREMELETEKVTKEIEPITFSEFELKFIVSNSLFRQRKRKQEPIIDQRDRFDFTPFQKKFPILLETNYEPGTIAWSYKEYIKKLLKEGCISTAYNYHCSYVSIKKFRGNVTFAAITTSYLIAYEQELKARGLLKSTVGIYLRPLRAIYNEAIETGFAKKTNLILLEEESIRFRQPAM